MTCPPTRSPASFPHLHWKKQPESEGHCRDTGNHSRVLPGEKGAECTVSPAEKGAELPGDLVPAWVPVSSLSFSGSSHSLAACKQRRDLPEGGWWPVRSVDRKLQTSSPSKQNSGESTAGHQAGGTNVFGFPTHALGEASLSSRGQITSPRCQSLGTGRPPQIQMRSHSAHVPCRPG